MSIILESSQLSMLRELQRNTSDRVVYQKLTVVLMLHNGFSRQAIADNLGLDPSTISRYSRQFVQSTDLKTYLQTHYKPCEGKLTQTQLETVRAYLQTNLCQAAHQVAGFILDSFGIVYQPNSVVNLLHRLGFVYKKTTLVPAKADLSAQAAFIETFRQNEQSLAPDQVILFGDAVHVQHNTQSEYAWIEKGQQKTIASNSARHRINLHGAINPHQPQQVVIDSCEQMNAQTTIVWLQKIEQRYADRGLIDLYVDNARYYHCRQVA